MLADELDNYKGQRSQYINNNIQKIQELYKNKEKKKKNRKVEEEEVILIKQYKVSVITFRTTLSKTTKSSFIYDEIKNLEQHMKFIHSLTQTRLFKPSPYYQLLCSREEQDPEFWREIAVAFVKEKHNIETSQNRFPISIYQEGPPYKPYFIAVNN